MRISVIIPTYNEFSRLPATFKEIKEFLEQNAEEAEIIISDGGSTDGTVDLIKSIISETGKIKVSAILEKTREGKGAGVKKGMLKAKLPFVLFMDADNSTKIKELAKFWPYSEEFQVIIGSRYAGIAAKVKQNIIRRFVSRAGSKIIRLITGLVINDTQCGFKLFTKKASDDIFSRLETKGWGFDAEVLLLAKKLGYKIKEVPVEWRDTEGSHLRAGQDSIKTLFESVKILKKINSNEKRK
jgi:glycosyltransferase involved in cell wall biosynthesis